MKSHQRAHTNDRPFHCSHCDKKFKDSTDLKTHIRLKHTGEKPYKCDECREAFPRRDYLKSHKYKNHATELPQNCNVCKYSCEKKMTMEIHKRSHTGEKPFQCETCPQWFSSKSGVLSHTKKIHLWLFYIFRNIPSFFLI